jgi:hypothetical protein
VTVTDLLPEWLDTELDPAAWASSAVPEVPAWLLEGPVPDTEPGCDCGCTGHASPLAQEPVRWAVPGVYPEAPTVGVLVARVQQAVAQLQDLDPSTLPPRQALAEAEALLAVQQRLRVLGLARTQDVRQRQLFAPSGFRSSTAWLRTVAPDAPTKDATLAAKLPRWPHLHAAVLSSAVSLDGADKVATALGRVAPYLDAKDQLLDGQPAEPVVAAVVGNVIDLVARDRFGLSEDPTVDPTQAALLAELEHQTSRILESGGSQHDQVEQAMVLLARYVHPSRLSHALEDLVLALVPSLLEQQNKAAHDKRALALKPHRDGTWDLRATLTPEAGEMLHAALAAESRRDPANPEDTAARARRRAAQAEAAGDDPWTSAPPPQPWEHDPDLLTPGADQLVPRGASVRLHDAFARLLSRYLNSGLGGRVGKVPVHLTATVSHRTIEGAPGAPPARGASGQPLARSLLRRWWCDAHVTTLLLSRGSKPLGIVHTARTLTGTELTAARVQFNNRCAGVGCCPGTPDPLTPLVPHHVRRHALTGTTSLDETLLVCERLHQDLHLGKRTVRLRDGRLVTEDGFVADVAQGR